MAESDDEGVRAQLENDAHNSTRGSPETPKKKKKRSRGSNAEAVDGEKSDRKKKKTAKPHTEAVVSGDDEPRLKKKKKKSLANVDGGVDADGDAEQPAHTPKSTLKKKTSKTTVSKATDEDDQVTSDIQQGKPVEEDIALADEASYLVVQAPLVDDEGKKRKSAKLPDNYKPTTNEAGEPKFPCPVDTCQGSYTRRDTVTQHLHSKHHKLGEILRDNGDGTLTITSSSVGVTTSDTNNQASSATPNIMHNDRVTPVLPPPRLQSSPSAPKSDKRTARTNDAANVSQGKRPSSSAVKSVTRAPTAGTNPDNNQPRKRSKITNGLVSVRPGVSAVEDWELGAGKVVGNVEGEANGSEVEDTLAFSGFVINGSKDGVKFPGEITFAIQNVPAGASHKFKPNESQRICSVANGKVQVNMGNEIFSIGLGGVFRVKTGIKCEILNQNYDPAVVHITAI